MPYLHLLDVLKLNEVKYHKFWKLPLITEEQQLKQPLKETGIWPPSRQVFKSRTFAAVSALITDEKIGTVHISDDSDSSNISKSDSVIIKHTKRGKAKKKER